MKTDKLPSAAVLMSLLTILSFSVCAQEVVELSGSYNITSGGIKDILVGDIDNDRMSEIIVVTTGGIHALNNEAKELWFYQAENIQTVDVSDIDGDGLKEITLCSGIPINNIEKGTLHILDCRGRLIKKQEPSSGDIGTTLLFYKIISADLDGNRYKELITGTATGVHTLADTYDRIMWTIKTNNLIKDIKLNDASGEIIARTNTDVYIIDSKGNLKKQYQVKEGIKKIMGGILTGDAQGLVIISQNDVIYLLDSQYNEKTNTKTINNIVDAALYDLNKDGFNELVIGSIKGIYILTSKLVVKAQYITEKPVKYIYFMDWDDDGRADILFSSGEHIYVINPEANLEKDLYLGKEIDRFIKGDLDNDGNLDAVVSSGRSIYLYEIKRDKDKTNARENYILAVSYLEMGGYDEAEKYLNEALRIYTEEKDEENIKNCLNLKKEIDSGRAAVKNKQADEYCLLAEKKMNEADAVSAVEYIDKAAALYKEINNTAGMEKCRELSAKIKTPEKKEPETLNISKLIKNPTDKGLFPIMSIFLLVAVVLLIIILLVKGR